MFIDVTAPPYGAQGNNSPASSGTNDTAFRNALAALAAAPAPRTLYVPTGRYFLGTAIRAEVSELTVYGQPGATLIGNAPAGSLTPEVFLIDVTYNNGVSLPVQTSPVSNVTIRDLRVEANTGRASDQSTASMIVVNGCVDTLIADLTLVWTGPNDATSGQTDGISLAVTNLATPNERGTTGIVRDCVCDNVPKAAFYAAQGSHDIQFIDCVARNAHGPVTGVGFIATGSTRVSFVNCVATGCSQYGLFVAVNNPGAATAFAASHVEVMGGAFRNNGLSGIFIGSGDTRYCPQAVRVIGAEVSGNLDNGVMVASAVDVTLAQLAVFDNRNFGIWVMTPAASVVTSRVQVVDCEVYNNRRTGGPLAGIGLSGLVDRVDVTGGVAYNSAGGSSGQTIGVGYYYDAAQGRPTNVRVMDVNTTGETKSLAGVDLNGNPDPNAYSTSGFVRLQASGSPEGQVPAPVGSEYVDLPGGKRYAKSTGTSTTGWVQLSP